MANGESFVTADGEMIRPFHCLKLVGWFADGLMCGRWRLLWNRCTMCFGSAGYAAYISRSWISMVEVSLDLRR
jgi:hypothetical protein